MSRPLLLLVLLVALGISGASAQTKKGCGARQEPDRRRTLRSSSTCSCAMPARTKSSSRRASGRDSRTTTPSRWRDIFAVMKALEPQYKQDDEVAYTWGTKGKVTKCSIYLESWEAGAKSGTGARRGMRSERRQQHPRDFRRPIAKKAVSSSADPKHMNDVLDLFKKQSDRAKQSLPKGDDRDAAAMPRRVARERQPGKIDLGTAAGDEVGKHAAGSRRHRPAQGAVAGVEIQIGVARGADDGRPVGRHRPQSGPERRARHVAAAREKIRHDVVERIAPRVAQREVVAHELRGSADADAVAEPGDRHLVGLVHHRGFGRLGGDR